VRVPSHGKRTATAAPTGSEAVTSAVMTLAQVAEQATYEVAVLGAGAAGMAAAIFAALEGRRVLLIERTEHLGGTSALSAATTWAPNTRHSTAVGAEDSLEKARGFLERAVGNHSPKTLREAFLQSAPKAIHELDDRTPVKFRARPFHPDYLSEVEGAMSFGRALEPLPFDAKPLGADLRLIRPPIPEFTILGGMMVDRDDVAHLLAMGRSFGSALHSAKLIGRYGLDRLLHGRGTRLVMGNALIGRMLLAARNLGIDIVTRARITELSGRNGGVERLVATQGADTRAIDVSGGVVLASGGFARHPKRRPELLPRPLAEHSPSAPGHTGELHDLALALGAHYGMGAAQSCFWAPVSLRRRADGSTAVFPHFVFDRSKPGIIAVGRDGRRFVNESTSYHQFVGAMYAGNHGDTTIPAYLIADGASLRKYGLGMVRPGGRVAKAFLADGYLTRAETLPELAGRLGIDADGLQATVAAMNKYARTGRDPEFARGTTVYERANGDPAHGPNPTLGPIGVAPFYAVRLYPGDIGSATGLVTDEHARVLREDGEPIDGLYACGNDMQSVMGGVYPGPGITIGPAIVFGYIAAKHASARSRAMATARVTARVTARATARATARIER